MAFEILDVKFERVAIVDDDESARDGYCDPVSELDVEPVPESGPLSEIDDFVVEVSSRANGVLCDYHLKKRSYATYNGDQLVERLYQQNVPAILCTSFTDADVTLFRRRRRYIPTLLMPSEVHPDNLAFGFERCLEEFKGKFQPGRKPWRTLVRVEEVVQDGPHDFIYVVVPSWSPNQKIRIYLADLPEEIRELVSADKRFHAQVNIGAESHEELYLTDWETN